MSKQTLNIHAALFLKINQISKDSWKKESCAATTNWNQNKRTKHNSFCPYESELTNHENNISRNYSLFLWQRF